MKVEERNEARPRAVEDRHYEPPWDFYDLASDPEDLRLYERFGFPEVARETRHLELVGDHELMRMERAA